MTTMNTDTFDNQPLVFTLAVSEAVFRTAREMVAAGLSQDYGVAELATMYDGYGLSEDWFNTVWEGAEALEEFDSRCNHLSGSV
jgi:hypothetical protein